MAMAADMLEEVTEDTQNAHMSAVTQNQPLSAGIEGLTNATFKLKPTLRFVLQPGSRPIPRLEPFIMTLPLWSRRPTIWTDSLKSTSDLPYFTLRSLTKRAASWLWNATPIFVLPIFVAGG